MADFGQILYFLLFKYLLARKSVLQCAGFISPLITTMYSDDRHPSTLVPPADYPQIISSNIEVRPLMRNFNDLQMCFILIIVE